MCLWVYVDVSMSVHAHTRPLGLRYVGCEWSRVLACGSCNTCICSAESTWPAGPGGKSSRGLQLEARRGRVGHWLL